MTPEPQPNRHPETPEPRAERSQGETSDDTKRLDWLEKCEDQTFIEWQNGLRPEEVTQFVARHYITLEDATDDPVHPNLRTAIDAALRPTDVATAPSASTEATPGDYEQWFDEALRIARLLGWQAKAIASIDREAWREYFDEGHTPAQAWAEEYDAANR